MAGRQIGRMDLDADALLKQLGALADALDGTVLTGAALAGGFVVEGAAKENVIRYDFIDTGATLNSIAAEPGDEAGEAEIGPETDYAIFGELGTSRTPPKPFMREALEQNQAAISEAVADELRAALRRAAGV